MAETNSLEDGNPYLMNEEIVERLKLINYETTYCKK